MVNGNQKYFIMLKETVFGTAPTNLTGGVVFVQNASMNTTVNMIDRPVRNIYLQKQFCQSIPTTNTTAVQLSGALTDQHQILLKSYFNKAATPYTVGTSSVADSYTIYQYDPVLASVQYVTGCALQNLSINGTYGNPIQFTADFTGKSQSAFVTTQSAGLTSIPTNSCDANKLFLMNSCSVTQATAFGSGSPYMDSFTLNLTTDLVDDSQRYYSNTQIINNNFKTKGATLTYKTEYDSVADANVHAQQGVINTTGSTITLNNANKHWAINVKGRLNSYTVDRMMDDPYANNLQVISQGNGSTAGITITVS